MGKSNCRGATPSSTGGAAISNHVVERRTGSTGTWTTVTHSTAITSTNYTVTGLTNGTAYNFRVKATNESGAGAMSNVANATPAATAPGAPTGLGATASNEQITLSWSAPSSTGGAAISNHVVERRTGSTGTWSTVTHSAAITGTNYTVTGLTNGTTYSFRVSAINSVGTGAMSNVASATPAAAAGAPSSLRATPGNGQVALSWSAPSSTGGAAITGYRVEWKRNTATTWPTTSANRATSTTTSHTFTGLTNGTAYNFRVSAINSAGTGAMSNVASATPAAAAGAPSSLRATPGNGQVALSWSAPSSTGGAAITGYRVEWKRNTATAWLDVNSVTSTTTSLRLRGLTNGTAYDFRVSAINTAGTGAVSNVVNATPAVAATAPGAPTSLTATAGNGQVILSWSAPSSNGGAVITGYKVEYKTSAANTWTTVTRSGTTPSQTVTGLTNGTTYNFRVSAINTAGTGTPTRAVNATPAAAATTPPVKIARAVASNVAGTVTRRIGQARHRVGRGGGTASGFSGGLGGQQSWSEVLLTHGQALADGTRSAKELLVGSSFVLPLSGASGGNALSAGATAGGGGASSAVSLWGSGNYRILSDDAWDGQLVGVALGVDGHINDHMLVGAAVFQHQMDYDYDSNDYRLEVTSLHPYLSWQPLSQDYDLWLSTGVGKGDLEGDGSTQDVSLKVFSLGGSRALGGGESGSNWRLNAHALWNELDIAQGGARSREETSVSQLGMALEHVQDAQPMVGGGLMTRHQEFGVWVSEFSSRQGTGRATGESVVGIEGLLGWRYFYPSSGLSFEWEADLLLDTVGYSEWGIQGSLRKQAGADNQGFWFALSPGYGLGVDPTQSVLGQEPMVWELDYQSDEATDDYAMRLDAKLGYGLSSGIWEHSSVLTPYGELTLGDSSETYRLGLRWQRSRWLDIRLVDTRSYFKGSEPAKHSLLLKVQITF